MSDNNAPKNGLIIDYTEYDSWPWRMNLDGIHVYEPSGPPNNVTIGYDPEDGELAIRFRLWHAGGIREERARIPAGDVAAFISLCESRRVGYLHDQQVKASLENFITIDNRISAVAELMP